MPERDARSVALKPVSAWMQTHVLQTNPQAVRNITLCGWLDSKHQLNNWWTNCPKYRRYANKAGACAVFENGDQAPWVCAGRNLGSNKHTLCSLISERSNTRYVVYAVKCLTSLPTYSTRTLRGLRLIFIFQWPWQWQMTRGHRQLPFTPHVLIRVFNGVLFWGITPM